MSRVDRIIICNGIALVAVLLTAAVGKMEGWEAALGHDVPAMRSAPALSSAAPIEPASPSRPLRASIAIAKGDAQ